MPGHHQTLTGKEGRNSNTLSPKRHGHGEWSRSDFLSNDARFLGGASLLDKRLHFPICLLESDNCRASVCGVIVGRPAN